MNIPLLSYILRKFRENLDAIKQALKTGKETEGETKQRSFLGVFRIVSGKRFKVLKLKKKKMIKAKAKIEKGKLKAKVKYPLVGGSELEVGKESKLKALIKIPFLFKAKLSGLLKLKRDEKK